MPLGNLHSVIRYATGFRTSTVEEVFSLHQQEHWSSGENSRIDRGEACTEKLKRGNYETYHEQIVGENEGKDQAVCLERDSIVRCFTQSKTGGAGGLVSLTSSPHPINFSISDFSFQLFKMSSFRFTSRILFGGLAAWFSRGMSILLGLVLMPVLFRNLSKEELGVWLLLGQSWAALGIFDLGFGVILTRRIAFVMGKNTRAPNEGLAERSLDEISNLMGTGRLVYRVLAFVAFGLSFSSGVLYLRGLELQGVSESASWVAWCVLCLSQAVAIWAAPWTCLLQGTGYVGWDNILASLANSGTLLVQMVCVTWGGGLGSLAIVAAAGALFQRWLVVRFIRRRRAEVLSRQGRWSRTCFRAMFPQALRAWMTSLGYLLVANTDQFFITAHQGTAA